MIALRRLVPAIDLSSTIVLIGFIPVLTFVLVWMTTWSYDRCVPGPLAWLFEPPWRRGAVVAAA